MQQSLQLSLIELAEAPSEDWTFRDAPTRELTHCYHDYPARMIPQVAGKLLWLSQDREFTVISRVKASAICPS